MTRSVGVGGRVISALARVSDDDALSYLRRYFGVDEWEGKEYEGAHFECFGERRADKMLADDIVAVSCLSIHVSAKASLAILGEDSDKISKLLRDIPADLALEDIPLEDHEKFFGRTSAVSLLWNVLRADGVARWGVGATSASKLMARKRPALIPVYDSVVANATGFTSSKDTWRAWHEAFVGDQAFTERLRSLRSATGLKEVTLLRVLDVVLWMHGSIGAAVPETGDADRLPSDFA